ncbi:prepilin-type N-terminal cleavage/methylation domain-containing protein [Halobacteriovorax sp.]|uniref:prepilin-type N-terminal cleavage/methylation domain-containing protein n=1 Tax=Halobacteriovorax sp. TaxID=2020862 RepID=UPI0035671328
MKKMLLILKNDRGFSLAEILVAAGLLGLLSLGVMQMNGSMMKGQATAEVKMEAIEIRRQIILNMSEKMACENTLSGTNLGDTVNSIKNTADNAIFTVGNKYGANALELESITVVDVGDVGGGMRDAELQVVFKSLKKAAYGSSEKVFKSRLKVKAANSTAPITECYDDTAGTIATANETSCISVGGTWDPATSKCSNTNVWGKSCPDGEVLKGFEDDGEPICVPNGVSAVQTFSLVKSGGTSASLTLGVWKFCALSRYKTTADDSDMYDNCYITGSMDNSWTLGLTKHSDDTLQCDATCFK